MHGLRSNPLYTLLKKIARFSLRRKFTRRYMKRMNPLKFESEVDYYERILGKYIEKTETGNPVSFEIFASREIVAVLSELKDEADVSEKKKIGDIAKNTIILILSLFGKGHTGIYDNFLDLKDSDQTKIRNELLPIICN